MNVVQQNLVSGACYCATNNTSSAAGIARECGVFRRPAFVTAPTLSKPRGYVRPPQELLCLIVPQEPS